MSKTKIDWCDEVWNPVWGCLTGCKYCYARSISRRFAGTMSSRYDYDVIKRMEMLNFIPTWLEHNFNKKFPKKPSRIFVNSMSDIEYWEKEWMSKVIEKIKEYPRHTFIFLTKHPDCYRNYSFPGNCLLGATITSEKDYVRLENKLIQSASDNKKFISMEPITGIIQSYLIAQNYSCQISQDCIDWLIIGAETGNRKNKIIPEKSWIEEFRNIDIPVFMKDNLKAIVGDNLRQEFPK